MVNWIVPLLSSLNIHQNDSAPSGNNYKTKRISRKRWDADTEKEWDYWNDWVECVPTVSSVSVSSISSLHYESVCVFVQSVCEKRYCCITFKPKWIIHVAQGINQNFRFTKTNSSTMYRRSNSSTQFILIFFLSYFLHFTTPTDNIIEKIFNLNSLFVINPCCYYVAILSHTPQTHTHSFLGL